MTEKTIFTGCSFTEGIGLEGESKSVDLWLNILHRSNKNLNSTELINLGKGGINNIDIFKKSVDALAMKPKFLFVSWTEILRFNINPSVETYNTNICISGGLEFIEMGINPGIQLTPSYLSTVIGKYLNLQHPHYELVQVLNFSNTLNHLADTVGTKIFFLNSLLPHDNNYFNQVTLENRSPSDTTEYTRTILNVSTRDDDEYFIVYDKIHKDYNSSNGLAKNNWLNLHNSFRTDFCLDIGNDNIHPGVKSNHAYANYLLGKLESML